MMSTLGVRPRLRAALPVVPLLLIGSPGQERAIVKTVEVPVDVGTAWRAWTTDEGVRGFFAPGSRVRAEVDGPYEIYFYPNAAPGERGSEGARILALQPERMISFTWNAPVPQAELRRQWTVVTIRFEALGERRTRVRLRHSGWGTGGIWDVGFTYFDQAWEQVMQAFAQRHAA